MILLDTLWVTLWTLPLSRSVHPMSPTGLVGCDCASFAGTPFTETGLLPTETCDDTRPLGEQRAQVVEVEPALLVDLAEANGEVAVVGELEPRGEMFASWSSFVTTISSPSCQSRRGAREREVERRHVRAERHLAVGRPSSSAAAPCRAGDRLVGAERSGTSRPRSRSPSSR